MRLVSLKSCLIPNYSIEMPTAYGIFFRPEHQQYVCSPIGGRVDTKRVFLHPFAARQSDVLTCAACGPPGGGFDNDGRGGDARREPMQQHRPESRCCRDEQAEPHLGMMSAVEPARVIVSIKRRIKLEGEAETRKLSSS